jgi:hypothetical protein
MTEPLDGTKAYLEYLDKEMTIMGILSTFCVAAAALLIDRVGSAGHDSFFEGLAKSHIVQVLIGSGLLMLAGLYFYLQRSILAFFYGSICMSIAKRDSQKSHSGFFVQDIPKGLAQSERSLTRLRPHRPGPIHRRPQPGPHHQIIGTLCFLLNRLA